MAKVRIERHDDAFRAFLKSDDIYNILDIIADGVLAEAEATASDAEKGAGGNIDGYASAGFTKMKYKGGTRAEAIIVSKASEAIALAAHFYTQRRDGVGHLRAALYRFTKGINHKKYAVGKNYRTQPQPSKKS